MSNNVAEYEALMSSSFREDNISIASGIHPRWKRKQQSQSNSSKDGPEKRMPFRVHSNNNISGDRFIPNRAAMDMELSSQSIQNHQAKNSSLDNGAAAPQDPMDVDDDENQQRTVSGDNVEHYQSALSAGMLGQASNGENSVGSRILTFSDKAPAPRGNTVNNLQVLYSNAGMGPSFSAASKASKLVSRHIPSSPLRILDAPDLIDDYYLNLISWNYANVLAVALSQTVFLWNAATGEVNQLCTFDEAPGAYVSSISWVHDASSHIAVGTSDGTTYLWDVQASKQLRSMDGHTDRVGALSWNRHILSSGGRDTVVVNHDVRVAQHNIATLSAHTQEVCGLSWSPDGNTLASGGNDNTLCLWNAATSSTTSPRYTLTNHQAAVKALAWSPHERNLLATGGGTADRCIKFWNGQMGTLLDSTDTGSQVCALQWNPHEKEILSSHGFARNQLSLWKYPTMAKIKELQGHTARVLHMALSPDGSTVVSAAADETLRFWNVFSPPGPKPLGGKRSRPDSRATSGSKKLSSTMHIR